MSDDDARLRRAADLRRQIAELTGRGDGSAPATPEDPGRRRPPRIHPLSPREFIEKRMHELDHPATPARDENGKG